MTDPYEILGIGKNATKQDIKKAYRRLAKEYHPDHNKSADAPEKFKDATNAYELLMDDQKRAAYDQYGFAGTSGFGGADYSQNYNDYFGQGQSFSSADFGFGDLGSIFDTFFGGGQSKGYTQKRGGEDLSVRIELEFMEAVFGTDKEINYTRLKECDTCNGTGAKKGTTIKTCPICNGRGKVSRIQRTFIGTIQTTLPCSECKGNGQVIESKCEECKGNGIKSQKEALNIKIPKGTPDGLTLRFKDKGNAGEQKSGYGDLYVEIEVNPTNISKEEEMIYILI